MMPGNRSIFFNGIGAKSCKATVTVVLEDERGSTDIYAA